MEIAGIYIKEGIVLALLVNLIVHALNHMYVSCGDDIRGCAYIGRNNYTHRPIYITGIMINKCYNKYQIQMISWYKNHPNQ